MPIDSRSRSFSPPPPRPMPISAYTPANAKSAEQSAVQPETANTLPPLVQPREPDAQEDNFATHFGLPPSVLKTKSMMIIFGIIFVVGLIFGGALFGGSSAPTTQGLGGVVANPEVPKNRNRCGIAERTQGCVLYMMNATRRDREARSFYDEAARVTGVPSYTIELGNIEYATSLIRPGYIAQINIPPHD